MRFSPNFLDEIRARVPVSQVVGRKVALKKAGREFRGLSPFKEEKSPSFFVNDQKGFYHCFASGEHGDIFTFLMKTEGVPFEEAVHRLAAEAQVPLPNKSASAAPAPAKPDYQYSIPKRLPTLLKRLRIEYQNQGRPDLIEIIDNAKIEVHEHATEAYDFDSTAIGHNIIFLLPLEVLGKTPLSSQDDVAGRIRSDLAIAARSVRNEFVNELTLDVPDTDAQLNLPSTRASSHAPLDWDVTFWKRNHFRVFISHRDTYKARAHELAAALDHYGISAFVAHDTIEPDVEWQIEIEKGLQTMEVMLALITDDFYDSVWTQQEVGFAIGRQTPVICAKSGNKDPRGFVQKKQAVKIDLEDPAAAARQIAPLIAKHVGITRFCDALIGKFIAASSFAEAECSFSRLGIVNGYSTAHAIAIIDGFAENGQLNCCYYLTKSDRLLKFLKGITGREYFISGKKIVLDEIPF